MRIDIYQGEELRITSNQFSLFGEYENRVRHHVKLHCGEKLLIEWKLPTIMFNKKITIEHQDLPFSISDCRHMPFLKFKVDYAESSVLIKFRPFSKRAYFIYQDGIKVAEGFFPKKFTAGYRQYAIETNTEDQTRNLLIVVAFLLMIMPIF